MYRCLLTILLNTLNQWYIVVSYLKSVSMDFLSLDSVSPLEAGPIPLYLQIANALNGLIQAEGKTAIGKLLPPENDCAEHFRVSRLTVRHAMSTLRTHGIITRRRGKGTFITSLPLDHDIGRAFEDEMRASGHNSVIRLLEWKRIPITLEIARIFSFSAVPEIYRMRRLRIIDGKIRSLEERYLPVSMGEQIAVQDLKTKSIFAVVRELTGNDQAKMQFVVSVDKSDSAASRMLKIPLRTTLVVRKNTCYFHDDQPFMYGIVRFVARDYQFRFHMIVDMASS
jgi:GntR family transcriptional regulator